MPPAKEMMSGWSSSFKSSRISDAFMRDERDANRSIKVNTTSQSVVIRSISLTYYHRSAPSGIARRSI